MSSQPLDELYLPWLYSKVAGVRVRNPRKSYWNLIRTLYTKEFIWWVPNDDNRVEDGRDLRSEFIRDHEDIVVDEDWMELACSFLEMLIALSRWLSFEAEGEPRDWFWHVLRNLELDTYNDAVDLEKDEIDDILDRVIWRQYDPDGSGGMFPLRNPQQDQRQVEIWYQLNRYLLENE